MSSPDTPPTSPAAALGLALTPAVEAVVTLAKELPDGVFDDDVGRIRRNAASLHELVATRLSPDADGGDKALQHARHDIRGVLGNIQNFAQLLQFEDDLPTAFADQLDALLNLTRSCSAELNASRDGAVSHVQQPQPEPTPSKGKSKPKTRIKTKKKRLKRKPAKAKAPPPKATPSGADAVVLVVDDDPDSRTFLNQFLKRQGHRPEEAHNGKQAIDKMAANDYDLVLLDINMPEMNGIQVLQHLKANNMLNHTPVLVISGEDSGDNIIRCIELGAEDFFPRDFDQRLLLARVNACLEKQKLREREFHQYFTPELARKLVRHPELLTTGAKREVSILFCDVVRFSAISLRLGPTDTIAWLSDVMGELSDCVIDEGGVLVDYTGDELMAMWGAPNEQPDHAARACNTARAIIAKLTTLNERWTATIGEPTRVSIGINSGEAFVGNVGTARKFKYGALGNTVNLASRIQGATKYLRTRTLIAESTRAALPKRRFRTRHLCDIRAKNIDLPVGVHELATSDHPNWSGFRRAYERALAHFEAGEFHKASAVLGDQLVRYPKDGPSLLLMSRVVDALLLDTPEDFDPVWTLPGK